MPIVGSFAGASSRAYGQRTGIFVGDFESISTVTVGSGGSSNIEFTNIPSTFTHLQIRGIARSSNAAVGDFIIVRFNSDSGSNYTYHQLSGNGSSASSAGAISQTGAGSARISASNDLSNTFGKNIIDILDYTNTNKYTTIRTIGGYDDNTNGVTRLTSGVWLNTASVTSISIVSGNGGNFTQYTSFALYGIKG